MFVIPIPNPPRGSTQTGVGPDEVGRPIVRARSSGRAHEGIQVGFTSEDERTRVLAWLDAGLRDGRPGRIAEEFPLLFRSNTSAVPILARAPDGRPASFCMLWPVRFELAGGTLSAGLVSLVYTEQSARGRGLARAVIARAVAEANRLGLGLCLLWSELADFYSSQGFTRAGRETLVAFDGNTLSRARQSTIPQPPAIAARRERPNPPQAIRPDDWPALLTLRSRRSCRMSLPAEQWRALDSLPDLDGLVVRDGEHLRAFALRGRGDDFRGVVHEWGGDPEGVLACCARWLEQGANDDGLLLLAPTEHSEVSWRLRRAGARVIVGPLAWFRIASPAVFLAELAAQTPGSIARIAKGFSSPGPDGQARCELTLGESAADVLSEEELIALAFSPADDPTAARARARLADSPFASRLEALPLPFFVWGLESI